MKKFSMKIAEKGNATFLCDVEAKKATTSAAMVGHRFSADSGHVVRVKAVLYVDVPISSMSW